jgi:putative membrane protein
MPPGQRIVPVHLIFLGVGVASLAVSGYRPLDPFTWVLEIFPAVIGTAVMIATYRRFPLTTLLYALILVHALILMVGGHYTYAKVPLGFWMQDVFGFTRNHYDRIGHFAQGFVPAMIARELFLRHRVIKSGLWLFVVIVLCCLGISAIYELVEWWTAELSGSAADAFLGTQGDPWDTQEDMFMAGVGATVALLTLSRIHDAALRKFATDAGAPGSVQA